MGVVRWETGLADDLRLVQLRAESRARPLGARSLCKTERHDHATGAAARPCSRRRCSGSRRRCGCGQPLMPRSCAQCNFLVVTLLSRIPVSHRVAGSADGDCVVCGQPAHVRTSCNESVAVWSSGPLGEAFQWTGRPLASWPGRSPFSPTGAGFAASERECARETRRLVLV